MTGARPVTEETFIRQLPYSVIKYFSVLADIDRKWEQLVGKIPKKLEHVWLDEFEKRYSNIQVRLFEQKAQRPDGSPTKSILDDWGTQNARLKHLLRVLQLCHMYQEADYLAQDVLHGPPVPRLHEQHDSIQGHNLPIPQWDAPEKQPPASVNPGQAYTPVKSPLSSSDNLSSASMQEKVMDKNISGFMSGGQQASQASMCSSEYSSLYKSGSPDSPYNYLSPTGKDQIVYNRVSSFESGGNPSVLLTAPRTYGEPQENSEPETLQIRKMDDSMLEDMPSPMKSPQDLRSSPREPCESSETEPSNFDTVENIMSKMGSCSMKYSMIQQITDNFNQIPFSKGGRSIGTGGFGEVFLGVFENGCKIAVKRLKTGIEECEKQFTTELESLSKYRHKNIVNLYGFSVDGPSKCLVYEYLCNGSLEDRLIRKDGTPPLTVARRLSILQGTAKGIDFLNQNGIVHRDIKSANVLLSDTFEAKVGDFATARGGPKGNTTMPMSTQVVIGTSAYLAPEALHFDVSTKLDSYSFGIVIYEVLTALPPLDDTREEKDIKSHIEYFEIETMLDMSGGKWCDKVVNQLMGMADRCTLKKRQRVNVSDILTELLSISVE